MAAAKRVEVFVALLRGINVGGNKKLPMAELRALGEGLGWRDVETFIQSGNVVFAAAGAAAAHEQALELAIERRFGFGVPVLVRGAKAWTKAVAACPFAVAADDEKRVHLGLAKGPLPAGVAKALQPWCTAAEQVVAAGGALWIDFTGGVARSKLSPAVLDRVVGSTVTLRNCRTSRELVAMAAARTR